MAAFGVDANAATPSGFRGRNWYDASVDEITRTGLCRGIVHELLHLSGAVSVADHGTPDGHSTDERDIMFWYQHEGQTLDRNGTYFAKAAHGQFAVGQDRWFTNDETESLLVHAFQAYASIHGERSLGALLTGSYPVADGAWAMQWEHVAFVAHSERGVAFLVDDDLRSARAMGALDPRDLMRSGKIPSVPKTPSVPAAKLSLGC